MEKSTVVFVAAAFAIAALFMFAETQLFKNAMAQQLQGSNQVCTLYANECLVDNQRYRRILIIYIHINNQISFLRVSIIALWLTIVSSYNYSHVAISLINRLSAVVARPVCRFNASCDVDGRENKRKNRVIQVSVCHMVNAPREGSVEPVPAPEQ